MKIGAGKAMLFLWVSMKLLSPCIEKQSDIYEVKNALAEPVSYVASYTICNKRYCLMSTGLYNEINKDMHKKPLLVRHNLSPHSLNKFPSVLPRWRHSFIRILCYQYIISLDLNTLSKLNAKRPSEYLCGFRKATNRSARGGALQVIHWADSCTRSRYSKEHCVTGRWLEGCGLAPDTLLLEQTVHCAETLHVPVKTLSQITSTIEFSVWWIGRGCRRSRLCSPLTVLWHK